MKGLLSKLILSMFVQPNNNNSLPKLPWFLEYIGIKRISKGNWVYPVRYKKIALDYIRIKPSLDLMHQFLRFYSEPRNRTQFI